MKYMDDQEDTLTEQEFIDGCHTDPRICAYCGQPFTVEPALSASIVMPTGGYIAQGDLMFARCERDGVLQVSSWLHGSS